MPEFEPNVPGPSTIHVIKKKSKQRNLALSRSHDGQEPNSSRKRKRIGVEVSSSLNGPRLRTVSEGKELDKPFIELHKRRKKRKRAKEKTAGDQVEAETGPSSVTLASSDSPTISSKEVDPAVVSAEKDAEIQRLQKELTAKNEVSTMNRHQKLRLLSHHSKCCSSCSKNMRVLSQRFRMSSSVKYV